eukprot:TRINITY_DN5681_c0_g1_i1.p1 TRINITY_DN5681_c0_g1~~TRINITY_DN5681_c0_g1_i1.p1  ORF type:complete len:164 (-),score=34.58 TRINITY_DN5681_c0_g1_i1:78-569(-)
MSKVFEEKDSYKELVKYFEREDIDLEVLDNLVKSLTEEDIQNSNMFILFKAAINKNKIEYVRCLIDNNIDVNLTDPSSQNCTAVIWAAYKRSNEILQLLIDSGGDINKITLLSETALYWASQKGFEDTVELLLENNAFLDAGKAPISQNQKIKEMIERAKEEQ